MSITEYRQRKKLNHNEKTIEENAIEESPSASQSPKPIRNRSNSSSSATSLASSDDETLPIEVPEKCKISFDLYFFNIILFFFAALSAFNSEPTELERERENLSSRLKKTYGLSVDEDTRKTSKFIKQKYSQTMIDNNYSFAAINVETLLKCDLSPPLKTTLPLSSPTFPIPGSTETTNTIASKHEESVVESPSSVTVVSPRPSPQPQQLQQQLPQEQLEQQPSQPSVSNVEINESEKKSSSVDPGMFYTPDEEESEPADDGKFNKIESTSYVPPFNNPLYPNNISYTTYGSVIGKYIFFINQYTNERLNNIVSLF